MRRRAGSAATATFHELQRSGAATPTAGEPWGPDAAHTAPCVGVCILLLVNSTEFPGDGCCDGGQLLVIGLLEAKRRGRLAVEVRGLNRCLSRGSRGEPLVEGEMEIEELPVEYGGIHGQLVDQRRLLRLLCLNGKSAKENKNAW